ncbi:MAG: RNA-binding cell elongation regulator Jag/EloR, partial [Clostridium sp.]
LIGPDMGILIGRRGETLDSLQYLLSLVINKENKDDKYKRVVIDTENYRKKREETLIRLANKLASRVKKSGSSITLEPMNPYERRVIHSALQGSKIVSTKSEGEEPFRKVVIELK